MIIAAIELAFDPVARLGGLAVPWQVLGVAAASFVALVSAALVARREAAQSGLEPLRLDDLLFVALGTVPGAVVGGRIVHAIDFLDVYGRDPLALLDPARGSLSLLGAVLGGTLTGLYIANLLDGRARRWAGVAAVPLLVAVGLGKLAQVLGGGGQGIAFDAPWSIAFTGPGPWRSPSPSVPAHPSQMYEGVWAMSAIPFTLRVWGITAGGPTRDVRRGPGPRGDRRADAALARRLFAGSAPATAFLLALAWWLLGRLVVGFTWRDDPLLGPLNVEQGLASVALAVVGGVLLVSVRGSSVARSARRRQGEGIDRPVEAGTWGGTSSPSEPGGGRDAPPSEHASHAPARLKRDL